MAGLIKNQILKHLSKYDLFLFIDDVSTCRPQAQPTAAL